MDPIVLIIALAILMPIAVLFALARASQLRGPATRRESRRRVESLVTEAIPEPEPDDDAGDSGPDHEIGSPASEPDRRPNDR